MRIPLLMAIISIVGSILVDLYIFSDIRNFYRKRRAAFVYLGISVALWVYLIVALCLPRRGEGSILPLMWMFYAYLTVLVPKVVYCIVSLLGKLPRLWHGKSWPTGLYAGAPLAVFIFALMWWGATFGREDIEVNRVEISSTKLPKSFDGFTIAQFSDAHVGTWGNDTSFVSLIVDSINALKPDMIVFTGDIVNRNTSEIEPFVSALSRLKAPYGVYSILGNHDYGDYMDWPDSGAKTLNLNRLLKIQKDMGWKMLNNETEYVYSRGDSIAVIGVENWGEPPFKQYGDLGKAYTFTRDSAGNLYDNNYKLLLSHNPEHWRMDVSENTDVDLTLSGHTHAMQMMISLGPWKWSPAKYRYEQWGGLYEKRNKAGETVNLYVNIGCGEVGMPFRIGATPEITLITLRSERK